MLLLNQLYTYIQHHSVLLSYRTISNLQGDIHITPPAFDVVGIEGLGIPAFEDVALAARFAVVQAFPGFEDIGYPLFFGGVVNLRWLHGSFKLNYCHLNYSVQFVLKDAVGFLNLTQWKTVRDERSGVNLSRFNKAKDFLAIASIDPTGLEGEVFAIHFGQRKHLRLS